MSPHLHGHKLPSHGDKPSPPAYKPPAAMVPRLGKIVQDLAKATPVTDIFNKSRSNPLPSTIFVLPSKALYIEGALQLDTDGAKLTGKKDVNHKAATSLEYNVVVPPHHAKKQHIMREPIDANAVPFLVLPGPAWPNDHGIGIGDFGIVLYESFFCYVIYVDNGPLNKLGEGSLALFRSLGQERLVNGNVKDNPMGPGVVTIVFPGSAAKGAWHDQNTLLSIIKSIGSKRFASIGGKA